MIRKMITGSGLPEYHEGLLIVKVRATTTPMMSFTTTTGMGASALSSPGMSALSIFERGGLIKRVTPLSRSVEDETASGLRRPTVMMAMSIENAAPTDPHAGVSIVELERDSDIPNLQNALASDPNVEFVSRVPVRYLEATARARGRSSKSASPGDANSGGATIMAAPPPASTLWNLRKIQWEQARSLPGFQDATNVRVAVLDTGVDRSHPDLAGRIVNYVYEYPGIPTPVGEKDIIGHGTHVSGTIGALINNDIGINGICECQLSVLKIFGDQTTFASWQQGFVYYVDPVMYRRALADCIDEGVDVINLSIGGPGKPDPQERKLFNQLLANGTTVVAAMGNERQIGSPISYPAAIPGVVAVGATNAADSLANFSNRGGHISLCAPGVGIWSTLPTYPGQEGFEAVPGSNGKPMEGKPSKREINYDSWDGTSMATPHVTAAVALLIAKNGKMSPADVRQQLMQTADKVAGMGGHDFNEDYGRGRMNLVRLLS
ncbi:MAG: S8 family serine peptidase [Pyrinomonadaceae bacterium]